MRRSYILAITVLSVYCLTDALASNRGEPASRSGQPTFSADFINLPIIDRKQDTAVDHAIAPDARPESPVGTNMTAATTLRELQPAPAAAPSMTRMATRRSARPHASKAKTTIAPAELPTRDYVSRNWGSPLQQVRRVTVALHSSAMGGCADVKWSQPDAAGVPVLVCN